MGQSSGGTCPLKPALANSEHVGVISCPGITTTASMTVILFPSPQMLQEAFGPGSSYRSLDPTGADVCGTMVGGRVGVLFVSELVSCPVLGAHPHKVDTKPAASGHNSEGTAPPRPATSKSAHVGVAACPGMTTTASRIVT